MPSVCCRAGSAERLKTALNNSTFSFAEEEASPWTPPKLVRSITDGFRRHRLPPPHRFEAEQLVAHALDISLPDIYLQQERPCRKEERNRIEEFCIRRLDREPLAYILGFCEFWTLRLSVGEGVLIPRQDTETIVEAALSLIPDKNGDAPYSILELGTGSAAIPLALATERRKLEIVATEISPQALRYARSNLNSHREKTVAGQNTIRLVHGDRFEPIAEKPRFDLVISNPPYVADSRMDALQSEIRRWEPREALAGGKEGLDFYRYLRNVASRYLKSGGSLLFEHGFDQKESIRRLFAENAGELDFAADFQDLNKRDRVMMFRKL